MSRTTARWIAVLGVAAAVALALALRREPGPGAVDAPDERPVGAPGGQVLPPVSVPAPRTDSFGDDLRDALAAGQEPEARRAATDLRRLLRTDPGARERAAALLLAKETPAALREALALVLGTLERPDTDALLLQALRIHGADPSFARCALLALGAQREPEEEDEVFDLGDRPHGARGPGGLGITVRRVLEDAGTRAAVAAALDRGEVPVRAAAATALRHSLASADARAAFLATLARETSDDVAPVLGEALAERAGSTADGAEREALVAALLERAGEEGFDTLRFRMENDFGRIPLRASERAALAALASDGRPFGTRAFALTALANAAPRCDAAGQDEIRGLLAGLVARSPDAAVRDLGARLLGKVSPGERELVVLRKAAREDAAWNVRYTALETFAARAPREAALEALAEARRDPDARVAGLAERLLKRP